MENMFFVNTSHDTQTFAMEDGRKKRKITEKLKTKREWSGWRLQSQKHI